jgi:prepilin-type N-terminal cleavage/methylation domain-containing protein
MRVIIKPQRRCSGFTLVEVLVVIAIVAVLLALFLPAVQQARESARRTQCKNNLKQLGAALHSYHDTYLLFPPGTVRRFYTSPSFPWPPCGGSWCTNMMSWGTRILPYIGQGALYAQVNFEVEPGMTGSNMTVRRIPLSAFRCPSDPGRASSAAYMAPTNYMVCIGDVVRDRQQNDTWNGIMDVNSNTAIRDVTDGTSNVMALSEIRLGHPADQTQNPVGNTCPTPGIVSNMSTRGRSWMYADIAFNYAFSTIYLPNSPLQECYLNSDYVLAGARSHHVSGVHVLLVDGSVRFIGNSLSHATWVRLGNKSDNEPVGEF